MNQKLNKPITNNMKRYLLRIAMTLGAVCSWRQGQREVFVLIDSSCFNSLQFKMFSTIGKMTILFLLLVFFNQRVLGQASQLTPIGSTLASVTNTGDSYQSVDITGVFPGGIKFGSTTYTTMYVGSNGYVTFGHGNSGYSPLGIAGYTSGPIIAGQYDDLHPGISGDIYYSQNSTYVVVTYSAIPPSRSPAAAGSGYNTFQIVLRKASGYNGSSNLNFQIEIRYMALNWAKSGNVSAWPTAGWSTGTGIVYDTVPYSGTASFTSNASSSNIGDTGVYRWDVEGGVVQSAPTVNTTDTVTSISGNSGFSGGNVSSDGGGGVNVRGLAYSTSPNPTIANSTVTSGRGVGAFTATMTGLSTGTTYYVRAYATSAVPALGTGYGPQKSFTTSSVSPPSVTTTAISAITTSSATSGYSVTNTGGAAVSAQGIVWNTSGSPTTGNYTGTSSGALASLSPNQTYYVRAVATNSAGTSYGSQLSFLTYPTDPITPIATQSTICYGISTQLSISNGQGTVTWYSGSCGGAYIGTGNPITVYPIENTTYFARNINTTGQSAGCTTGLLITVNQPASAPASATASATQLTTASVSWGTATGLSPVTYTWVVGSNAAVYGTVGAAGVAAQGTTISLTEALGATGLTQSTTYYLRVKASNSCNPLGSAYITSASFRTHSLLTYDSGSNGTVSLTTAPGEGSINQIVANTGGGSAVYAVPNDNYHFVNWSDGSTTNPRTDSSVTNSITVTANFAINILEFSVQPSSTVAGANIILTIRIKDKAGSGGVVMTNSDQSITLAISTNPTSGTLTGTTLTTVNGIVSTVSSGINKVGTGYKLTATALSLTSAITADFNITPAAIDHFTLVGITDPVVAGTTTTPVITAYDIYDNIKTNYTGTIVFSSDDNYPASLPDDYTFVSGDNGVHTFTNGVTLKTIGEHTVIVAGDTKTGSQSAITVSPAAINEFTLVVNGPVTAGTPFTVTARVKDIFGNTKTNYSGSNSVNWTTTATSSPNGTARIIPANGNQTFTAGVATISGFTFFNSDQSLLTPFTSPTITITDAPSSRPGTAAPITVNHAPLTNFKVVAGTTQTAGTPFSAVVTARDVYWNTATTYAGNISFSASDDDLVSYPSGGQSFAGNNGVRTFNTININTYGVYWLRAADEESFGKSGQQENVVVGPGAFSALVTKSTLTISVPATPLVFVDPLSRIAGEHVLVTLTPRDAQGNLLHSCRDISVMLNNSTSDYDGPIVVQNVGDGSYTALVRVTRTGNNIFNAKYNSTSELFVQTRTVSATAVASRLIIFTEPSATATAGVFFSQQPVVRIQDEFGNLISNDNTTVVTAAKSSGTDVLKGTLTTIATGGVATFSGLYYSKAELITLGFTSTPALVTATSSGVLVGNSLVNHFDLNAPDDITAGGSRAAYTVTRQDVYHNPATSGSQTVYLYSGSAGSNKKFYDAASAGNVITQLTIADVASTANFWYYDEKTGSHTITVSDATPAADGATGIIDVTDQITVVPDLLKDFIVYGVGNPHDLGTTQSVTVEPRDTYNNRKTDYVGRIKFHNTDATAVNPWTNYYFTVGDNTKDNGIHTFNGTGTETNRGVKFSKTGSFWLNALDVDEPDKYGAQPNIIVQRAVTITANARSKTYGDLMTLGVTAIGNCSVTGIVSGVDPVSGEIIGINLSSEGTAVASQVGDYDIVPTLATGTYTPGYYRIVYSSTGKLTIGKRTLTLSSFLANNKVYDQNTDVTGPSGSRFSDNRISGDDLSFSYTAAFTDKNVAIGKTVNYAGISINGGTDQGNYTLASTTGSTTANITSKTVTPAITSNNRCYISGNTFATLSSQTLTGVISADVVTLNITPSNINFSNDAVGAGKTVTATGLTLGGAGGGNYTLNGVTTTTNTAEIYALPIPAIKGAAVVCLGTCTYTTEAGMTGYTWSVPTGGSITGGSTTNSITVDWTNAGDQTVTVNYTNPNLCTAVSATVKSITVNPSGQVNQPESQVICNAAGMANVTFGTTNTGGTTTYTWTNNLTSIGLAATGSSDITSFTATNTTGSPVIATIVVTPHFTNDGVTCDGPTKTFTLKVNNLPTITTTGIAAAVSYSASARTTTLAYSATASVPISYRIDWNTAANTAGLADQSSTAYEFAQGGGTLATIAITGGTTGGTYNGTMTIINASGCTAAQAISIIVTNTIISATAITGILPPVAGATPLTTIVTGTGYTGTVTWSPAVSTFGYSTIYTATITLTTMPGYTFTGVTANQFTIAGSTSATNGINSGVITAAFPATGAAPSSSSSSSPPPVMAGLSSNIVDNVICAGDAVTFTGTGAATGTYEFFVDGISQGTASKNVTFTTSSLTNGQVVNVKATNSNGISASSSGFAITVKALLTVEAIIGAAEVCVGSAITFASTTNGGVWTSEITGNATVNASRGIVTGKSAGTSLISYSVINGNGCVSTVTRTVTVNALPVINEITGSQMVCVGTTTSFASSTSGGVWTSGTTANASVNAITGVIKGVSPGISLITYTVTNSYGCVNTATRLVTVNPLPTINTLTGTPTVCVGSTTTFGSTTTGGVWTSGTATVATINALTGFIKGISDGTAVITYTVTNGNGCTSSAIRNVNVNPLPAILSALPATRCDAGALTLGVTASEGAISWYADASGGIVLGAGISFTTPVIAVSTSYYAEVVSAGCKSTVRKSVTATISSFPTAPVVTFITQPTCSSANATVILGGLPVTGNWTLTKSPTGMTVSSNGPEIVLSDVVKGTYTFRVTNAEGCTSPESANVVIIAQPTLPASPVSKTATIVSQNGFTANWDASANAAGYLLDVSTDIGFITFVPGYSGTNTSNKTSYIMSGLNANTTYYYRVRPYNACGTGTDSGSMAITTPAEMPSVAIAMPATNILQNGFTANWSACTTTSGYWLDVATDIGFTTFVTGYNKKDAGNVTSSVITGLNPMITYYFRVRAYNTNGTSGNSNTAFTKTLSVPPAAPDGLVVSSSCNNLVILKWKKNADPFLRRYRIYRGTGTNPTTRLDSTGTSASDTTKTIFGLTEGLTYYFRVTAVNNDGTESPYSAQTTTVIKLGFLPVISLKWDDVLVCSNVSKSISSYQWHSGNSSIPGANDQYYSTNKIPGVYKVFTVDNFGCLNSSATITVVTTKSLTVYPNPASVNFTLRLYGALSGKAVITMFNASGLKVAEVQAENVNEQLIEEIAVNKLDNGVYVVQVLVNQQELYYTKMIVKK